MIFRRIYEQPRLSYFNQTRLTDKSGIWINPHLRAKENFTDNFSQTTAWLQFTYYANDNTKLSAAYADVLNYPGEGQRGITQPRHR